MTQSPPTPSLRVVLGDDHPIVMRGLTSLLQTQSDIFVVATAADGLEVVEAVREHQPDCLVVDLQMPYRTGLEAIAELKASNELPPTILIAASAEPWQVVEAERLGVWGIVFKDQASEVIIESVLSAIDGEPGEHFGEAPVPLAHARLDKLSDRERQIARLVASGSSNKAIAKHLGIATGTVKAHLYRIYKKLDVPNRVRMSLLWRQAEKIRPN